MRSFGRKAIQHIRKVICELHRHHHLNIQLLAPSAPIRTTQDMAYCITQLPHSVRTTIHGLLEGLDRLDYVRRHGGTPSAQAFGAFRLTTEESDYEPVNETGLLWSKLELRLCGDFCPCEAMSQPHCGHKHFRMHTVKPRAPCADCRLGRSCRLGGACVKLHTWFCWEFIVLHTYNLRRAMTISEWTASIRAG